ncbi:hypothetical protein CDL15_Pgr007401 [Punica granatum]|uniref:Uncharacterized protein n=1 Tax=Punica granatum TaxID=22663 RepID=A0A218X8V4_PUNGR|nr:hypothetical protein CDL15_Pgr007401 [Punica granatum]
MKKLSSSVLYMKSFTCLNVSVGSEQSSISRNEFCPKLPSFIGLTPTRICIKCVKGIVDIIREDQLIKESVSPSDYDIKNSLRVSDTGHHCK